MRFRGKCWRSLSMMIFKKILRGRCREFDFGVPRNVDTGMHVKCLITLGTASPSLETTGNY